MMGNGHGIRWRWWVDAGAGTMGLGLSRAQGGMRLSPGSSVGHPAADEN
jgi:hypothetical protein